MFQDFQRVYQFKILLEHIAEPAWRRIQVPETYTFWDLHVAIQCAMGWKVSYPYEFDIRNPHTQCYERIGIPLPEEPSLVKASWNTPLNAYFSTKNKEAIYEYNFRDDWIHTVTFEKVVPRKENVSYPLCISGKNASPLEEGRGGAKEYDPFSKVMTPQAIEDEYILKRERRKFNTSGFKAENILFMDPHQQLKALERATHKTPSLAREEERRDYTRKGDR